MGKKNEELLEEIKDRFNVEISGIDNARERFLDLKQRWFFISFSQRQEKQFLQDIIPKIKSLKVIMEKELEEFFKKNIKEFLEENTK